MSYPGYPSYPQAPGQQNNQHIPPAYQATTPMSYPVYPGSAAPQPCPYVAPYSYPSSAFPPSNPPIYPGQAPPYPGQAAPAPYPGQAAPAPYPGQAAPYPGQAAPYPGAAPGPYPPQSSMYPSAGPYPPAQQGLPSQPPSYPPSYPSQPEPSHPTGSAAYPSSNTTAHSYGSQSSHVPYPGAAPVFQSAAGANPAHNVQSSHQYRNNEGQPTLRAVTPFYPREDAEILRKAMKGFGTDEKTLIQVLTKRTNNQRLEIATQFKTLYGKDLIADIKSEVSGKFEDLLVALLTPIPEFLAKEINHALSGIGTNEETLVEILCTATNNDIRYIRAAYHKLYFKDMEKDLTGDTSGNFRRLLVSLCQGARNENYMVDPASAVQDAQTLLRAGELRIGTDESTFNSILCSRSYPQLAQIFIEYQKLSGHDFEKAVRKEFSGDIEKGLVAIVKSVRDKCGFFAEQLYESMAGMGTKDRALIRILSTRCEVDMVDIKRAFQAKYGKTLEDFISGDASGDYKKALISLIS